MYGTESAQFSLAEPKATEPLAMSTCHSFLNSFSAIASISLLNSSTIFLNRSCICSGVNWSSVINRSTLLMNSTGWTLSRNACFRTVSVCGIIPSEAQTKTIVPSMALMARVTFPPKSTCPGVSMRLMRYSWSS